MTQVLEIPDLNIPAQELKMILAEALFSKGSVSLGKAAQIAGYSERTFSELLLKKGVSPVIFDEEHMEEDIRNAWHTEGDRWHLCVDRIWKAGASSSFMFALAYISGTTILVDDLKARKTAKKLGCRMSGTIGVLHRMQRQGLISSAYEEMSKLKNMGFRVSTTLMDRLKISFWIFLCF